MCNDCYKYGRCAERDMRGRCSEYKSVEVIRQEIRELMESVRKEDNDWHNRFRDSTVNHVGKYGHVVHLPVPSGPAHDTADGEGADPGGLGEDNEGNDIGKEG